MNDNINEEDGVNEWNMPSLELTAAIGLILGALGFLVTQVVIPYFSNKKQQPTAAPSGLAPGQIHITGGKSGKVEISNIATVTKTDNDAAAKQARLPHRKDQSGIVNDGKKKEAVFNYLNQEGGSVLDPANKGTYQKVKKGELK